MSDLAKLIEFFKSEGYQPIGLSEYTALPAKKRDKAIAVFTNDNTQYLRVGLNLTFKFNMAGKLKGMD